MVYGVFQIIQAVGLLGIAFRPPLFFLILSQMVFAAGFALIGPAANVVYVQVIPPNIRTQGFQITGLAAPARAHHLQPDLSQRSSPSTAIHRSSSSVSHC